MKNRLKEIRQEKGLTLDEIQNKTGIKRGTYNNYENSVTEPKLETWQKLADFFDVSVPYLQGISKIKNVNAFKDFQTFIDVASEYEKETDSYKFEAREAIAFMNEKERRVFSALGKTLLRFDESKSSNEELRKLMSTINNQIDISDINRVTSDTFKIMIKAKAGDKKAKSAVKEIKHSINDYLGINENEDF